MEIIGTELEEKERKSRSTMILISIALAVLFIISIVLFFTIKYLKEKQFKLIVNDQVVSSSSYSDDLFIFQGEKAYISLKDIDKIIGYKFYNGGYKQYTEDINKCYLECDNEVTTFERDSDKIYKTPVNDLDYTYYTLKEPIKRMNGKLYIESSDLAVSCNLQIYYSMEKNRIQIHTLPYLVSYYTRAYSNSAVETNFNNQKALLYGLMVVQSIDKTEKNSNGKVLKYGVNNLQNEEIIGMKYTAMEFIEGTEEFIVTTDENKVGLITSDGDTRVSPQYDALKQIDKDLNLYLATNNSKNGVIERNGKILIYPEYDQIGVDLAKYSNNDIKNKYILFNNAIPVQRDKMWGLYDKEGKQILPLEYTDIGCSIRTSEGKSVNSVLAIPSIEGIVLSKELEENEKRVTRYGVFSATGKELVPVRLENIYSVTTDGQEIYTMVFNGGQTYDLIEYVRRVFNYESEKTNTVDENTVDANETENDQNGNEMTSDVQNNTSVDQDTQTNANVVSNNAEGQQTQDAQNYQQQNGNQ